MTKPREKQTPTRVRIQDWCDKNRYSGREFADLIGVAHNNISLILLGKQKITPWMAEKLVTAMGGDWWDYITEEDRQ